MRRILMLLTVVALMLGMLAMSAGNAFADGRHVGLCIKSVIERGGSNPAAAHTCTGEPSPPVH